MYNFFPELEKLFESLYPLSGEDTPELNVSSLLDAEGNRTYQQLIGICVWLTIIGRGDILFATTSYRQFSATPKVGHVKSLERVFGYLNKNVCDS